jgi:ceramide synthetase
MQKPWFWDASYCFDGYPYQEVSVDIRNYYLIEAGFYTSLMISQFTDVQRKVRACGAVAQTVNRILK